MAFSSSTFKKARIELINANKDDSKYRPTSPIPKSGCSEKPKLKQLPKHGKKMAKVKEETFFSILELKYVQDIQILRPPSIRNHVLIKYPFCVAEDITQFIPRKRCVTTQITASGRSSL